MVYLQAEDVVGFYREIFQCTYQEAADQLRSSEALESALARPQWYAHYQSADLAYQAAVLAHGIAKTQPLIEGNKRTALAALRAFLLSNGYQISASQQERAAWMLRLSEGMTPEELAGRIRASLDPVAG